MDFDASSAEPVAAVAEPEFDAESAVPVTPPKKQIYAIGEIAPGMTAEDAAFLKDVSRSARTEGSFAEKRLAPAAREAMTGVELPALNDPGASAALDATPGGQLVGALYEGAVKPLASALTAPMNLVLAPIGITEATGSFIAKTISKAAQAYFAGDAAVAGGEKAAKVVEVFHDPHASDRDKMTALIDAGSTFGFGAFLAGHAAGLKFDPSTAEPLKAEEPQVLSNQPVKLDVRRPDGSTVEVEMPAAKAEGHIKQNIAALEEELNAVYKQAGVERTPPAQAAPVPSEAFDAASAEPFVAETAKALTPEEPKIQVTIQKPQVDPQTGKEIPGYVQLDPMVNEGRGEPLTDEQRAKYPSPEEVLSTDLPTGQYSLEEVQKALAEKNVSSTKNAYTDQAREERSIAAADQAVVRDFPEVKAQADQIIAEDPQAGERLVTELKDTPRALTDVENAVLLHRQVQLENEFKSTPISDTEAINRISDELTDIYNADRGAGTETGRGLNARKMAIAEDFSLANLVTLRRAVKGTRLTPEELQETASLHEKIATLQKELDAYKQKATEEQPAAKRSRIVQTLADRADAARERLKSRLSSGRVSAGLDPADLRDYAEIGAYHIARGVEAAAQWSAEMVNEFGEKITPHLPAIREQAEKIRGEAESEKMTAAKLSAYKKRTFKRALEIENKTAIGDFEKTPRVPPEKDPEALRLQAKLESAKAEFAAALERDRFDKLSAIGKLREQGLNTYDAARNLMTTGEFSFILRQGKMTALSHPILTAKAIPATVKALFSDEIGARALDLQTLNSPDAAAARAAKLHLVEEGAKLSRQEEIFASKWAEKIPVLRNFNQAGRVFLNKVRFDVWKNLREQLPEITPERDKQLATFVNEATGRGTLGGLEAAAVPLGRALFSPRYLASRIQLLVGHSLWGGDAATRRIIAKEYAKTLTALGIYYTLLAQMKDKNGKPATIEKDPRSSDFGKVKVGNTRLDPLAGLAQVITFGARTATLERKDAKGKIQSLKNPPFGGQKWSDVATNFGRSKLHPVPGAIVNLFNGTDLAGNPATIQNQLINFSYPLTYQDVYQALQEQDMPEAQILSLLTLLGEGLQTYDTNKKRKPVPKPNRS